MSKSITAIAALGLFVLVSACGQQEEAVTYVDVPVTSEPVLTKY